MQLIETTLATWFNWMLRILGLKKTSPVLRKNRIRFIWI